MGRPKGLLAIDGRPILCALLQRIAWPGPTLLVTAPGRERPPGSEAFDREVRDPVAGEGPLRGVLTALEHATTDMVLVAVVDMPAMTRAQLDWLIDELADDPAASAVMTRRGEEIEPFPSAFRRGGAERLVRTRLAGNERALKALAHDPRVSLRPAPDWPAVIWTNLNGPDDVETYARITSGMAAESRGDTTERSTS